MLNNKKATDIAKKAVDILHKGIEKDPRYIISELFHLFQEYTEEEIVDLETIFVVQEYNAKHGPIDGRLADMLSMTQILYVHPEAVFDKEAAFINAVKLVADLEPNYDEDVSPSIYSIVRGYLFLKMLLGISLGTAVLPTSTADVVAMQMDRNHETYFPDARVMKYSYPALCLGRSKEAVDESERLLHLYDTTVLPLLPVNKSKKGFLKSLNDMKGYGEAVMPTVNILLEILETYYSSQKYVKK